MTRFGNMCASVPLDVTLPTGVHATPMMSNVHFAEEFEDFGMEGISALRLQRGWQNLLKIWRKFLALI